MKAKTYDSKGKEKGSIDLPDSVFGVELNNDLVHQVYVSSTSNRRAGTASTKTRDEVRGGGRKPWAQKGTGRARHGSNRSPIWRGGGITHGPTTERNWDKKINRKMRDRAIFVVLSQKLRDGEIIFVDSVAMDEPKTAVAKEVLKALSTVKGYEDLATKRKNAGLVTNTVMDTNVIKSFANIGSVKTEELRKLNIVDLLTYKYLVVINPAESVGILEAKLK